jgi:hypothetical protein
MNKDKRKDELLKAVNNDISLLSLVEDMVYLEEELDKLRKLPKLRVNPRNASQQKQTPAAKLYREYLQQYTNVVKVLLKATGADQVEDESPLRKWMNEHIEK